MIAGRGESRIQGMAVLADESEGNGAEIIMGMHQRLEEWWNQMGNRRMKTDGYTHDILPKMFIDEDAKTSGLK